LWGFLLHAILYVAVGRARDVKGMMWGLAALSGVLLALAH
jgi:xanthine/uracil/vitamin C permease (AzgA family)